MRHEKLALIFGSIYRHKAVSRDQLAQEADVSPASISSSTNGLLNSGILRVTGERSSRGGRRAEILELNGSSRFLIGVDLQGRFLRIGLADLTGEIHKVSGDHVENSGLTFDAFTAELKAFLDSLEESEASRLLAIGIGTPEILDLRAETMISSNRVQWLGVKARCLLEQATGHPVYLARSVDAAILGEKWFGAARTAENSIVITLGGGVGCGLLLDNQLYAGSSAMAGEFGHITVEPAGIPCYCGKRGCLEMYAAESRIIAMYCEKHPESRASLSLKQLCQHAREGDQVARQSIERACYYLGLGISNLIQLLNPEQIILGGTLAEADDLFRPEIERVVKRFAIPMLAEATRLVSSRIGPDAGPKGSAAFALHQLINSTEGIRRLMDRPQTMGYSRVAAPSHGML